MKHFLIGFLALQSLFAMNAVIAEPEYVPIKMEINVNKSAEEVWAKVGGYCVITEWLGPDCEITSGDGGIGTVRVLAGGRIIEILVAQTELSYGYTQPVQEGTFYNLYHGFLEARPVSASSSKLIYTLLLDVSDMADQAAKDANITRRRESFERGLAKMKEMAEN